MPRRYLVYSAILVVFAWSVHASAQTNRPSSQRPTPSGPSTQTAAPPVSDLPNMPAGNAEHGRYLAEHVAMCVECHSGRDSAGNILPSERYVGAPIPFVPPFADWATRAPRNRGLPGYTDKMAMRLLTEGAIGRDGRQLRPPMPRFRMTPQDAADVIAFLRSLR
jgi:mono/diheme cytochrome c family protein